MKRADRKTNIGYISKELHKPMLEVSRYFDYLDELKKSGQTKFFGGIPRLMEKYNLTREQATKVVMKWTMEE